MRQLSIIGLTIVSAMAVAQTPVSAYDFKGSLNPYINTNAPNVQPSEHRTGSIPTQPYSPTNYSNTTVGTANKSVVEFAAPQFFRALHGMNANGGGSYVNLYTIALDIKLDNPTIGTYASLFNTTADCGNDGDSFVRWDDNGSGVPTGRIGISGQYAGDMTPNEWHRVVISVDCSANAGADTVLTYYLDGVQVNQVDNSSGLDGRWAAYCWNDNDTDGDQIDLLGDEDGDNGTGQLSLAAFYDSVLTAQQVADLGPVGSAIGKVVLAPTATTIALGNATAGDNASLASDDANFLKVCKGFVPSVTSPRIRIDSDFTSPYSSVSAVSVALKARMSSAGIFKVRAFVADRTGGGYTYGAANQAIVDTTINTTYTVFTGNSLNPTLNVHADNTMRTRIEIQQTGFSAVSVPCAEFELLNVTVTP